MPNTALQRLTQANLTNKSGGSVAQGDVVVVDLTTAASFTTTTTSPFINGQIGVVLEPNGIANTALGMVAFSGPVPKINLSASASLGDLFKTHTVAKQAVRHAAGILAGDFGIVLGTGASPAALLWGLPAGATGAGSGDFSGPGSAVDGNLVVFNGTTGKLGKDGGAIPGTDGWTAAGAAWTYVSADGPTGVFSEPADVTGKYQPGMRVKYTQTTVKYGIITAVGAYSGGVTPITIYGGTDYTTANAAITLPYYSMSKAPFGMNISRAKWTEVATDTSSRAQASPVTDTWYNLGAVSLSIPIGAWAISYEVLLYSNKTAGGAEVRVTLSTANNSQSDISNTAAGYSAAAGDFYAYIHRELALTLAAKASYYINTSAHSGTTLNVSNMNNISPLFIRALCAYL